MRSVAERFLNYVTFDTRSDDTSAAVPTTPGQLALAEHLLAELKALGLKDAKKDHNGYVTATVPGNRSQGPVIGLIAHMDTSPDFSGRNVKPRIHRYEGGEISLNDSIRLKPDEFPELQDYIGQDLIVTDGTTLLGADDKAGIAEIMTAVEFWLTHPEVPRCTARICFTPDEEVGRGADHFDVEAFGADFAYTLDGGPLGELEYENFNAASVTVRIQGVNIHPGTAKNKMKNAILMAHEFIGMLPASEIPACTEGYEGFYHVTDFEGEVERATLRIILRDHDPHLFRQRKTFVERIGAYMEAKYGTGTVAVEIRDSYFNMKEKVLPVFHIVETAREAMESLGIRPLIKPIRGGTDGARLSFMGLPTPNLFTGGHNYHGKYEYIPIPSMEKAVETIVRMFELYAMKRDE